jgi:hypothetical protein
MLISVFIDKHVRGMRSFVCLILLIAVAPSFRATQDFEKTICRLEGRYNRASTLGVIRFERYTDGNSGISAESGTVYFPRPGNGSASKYF